MIATTNKIVKRAFNLADLGNTDFISHEEVTDYLNDSFRTLYTFLINHDDKAFVKEVYVGTGEYDLPDDFYQMRSLKDPYTGTLISRHNESDSEYKTGYEIINDKLRIYGSVNNYLLLTYWVQPAYLSYTDRDIGIRKGNVLTTAGNTILYEDGALINIKTNEQLGQTNVDLSHDYVLGNGNVLDLTELNFYNFDGEQIYSIDEVQGVFRDEEYNIYYTKASDSHFDIYLFGNKVGESDSVSGSIIDDEVIGLNEVNEALNGEGEFTEVYPVGLFDDKKAMIGKIGTIPYLILKKGIEFEFIALDFRAPFIRGFTKYGFIVSNGTDMIVKSWIPNTALNFPSEIYYQCMAAELGLRFLTKQNADVEGLNSAYEGMKQILLSSMGQDANYPRMNAVNWEEC